MIRCCAGRLAPLAVVLSLIALTACDSTDTVDPQTAEPETSITVSPTVGPDTTESNVSTATVATLDATTVPVTDPSPPATDTVEPAETDLANPDLPHLPAQPDDVAWPTTAWPEGPLPAGVDQADIDAAVSEAFGSSDAVDGVKSVVIISGGEIVYERDHPLVDPTLPTSSFSVAKSFTAATIGLLVGDGLLDVDEPAPVDEWSDPADPRHAITVADLLHMASGLEWTEDYADGNADVIQMLGAPVAGAYAASKPLESEPGTVFEYSTGTTAILAMIVADVLGGPEEQTDYVQSRLLDPIGMTSTTLFKDPSGRWVGGLGADSSPADFARFGLMVLRDGTWDGERILPEGWVDYMRTPSPAADYYGAQWWLDGPPGSFMAVGLLGQHIDLYPELDLIVVITSVSSGPSGALSAQLYELFV
jgi:CubicO group peptidase (beta-lactamase class C family)